jgi:nitrous oxide reductase
LAGFIDGKYQVMPAENVQSMSVRRSAPGKTAALVAAGAMGVAAAVVAISGSGGSTGPCSTSSSDCEM